MNKIIVVAMLLVFCFGAPVLCMQDEITEIFTSEEKLFKPMVLDTIIIDPPHYNFEKEYSFKVKYRGTYEVYFEIENSSELLIDSTFGNKVKITVDVESESKSLLRGDSDWLFSKGGKGGTLVFFHSPKNMPLNKTIVCNLKVHGASNTGSERPMRIRFLIHRLSALSR